MSDIKKTFGLCLAAAGLLLLISAHALNTYADFRQEAAIHTVQAADTNFISRINDADFAPHPAADTDFKSQTAADKLNYSMELSKATEKALSVISAASDSHAGSSRNSSDSAGSTTAAQVTNYTSAAGQQTQAKTQTLSDRQAQTDLQPQQNQQAQADLQPQQIQQARAEHANQQSPQAGLNQQTPQVQQSQTAGPESSSQSVPQAQPKLIPLGRFRLTAYCPCDECSEGYGALTSTGRIAQAGRTIAVDPRVIPYGSHVLINGHEYIAEDTGGAIKKNRIDIFFNQHAETLRFGVQYAEVYLIQ